MNTRETNQLDALKRAYVFVTGTPLPPLLQNNPPQGLADEVTALKAAIDAADIAAQAQHSGAVHQVTAQRQALRANLRHNHLAPILRVARVLVKTTPGLPKLVNIKAVRGEQALIAAAQVAIRDLTPYKALFIAKGLPADFLDQLQSAITALTNVADDQRSAQVKRTQARTGVIEALKDGDAAKQVLNAVFRREAATDPNGQTFLRGWEAASHVRRSKSSPSTTTTTSASPTKTSTAGTGGVTTTLSSTPSSPSTSSPVLASPPSTPRSTT